MFDSPVTIVASYTQAGHARYVIDEPAISLHTGGYASYRINDVELAPTQPFVLALAPGMEICFRDKPGRFCWSTRTNSPSIRGTNSTEFIEVNCEGNWVRLPTVTWLREDECQFIEAKFKRMHGLFTSPVPINRMCLQIAFADLLREVVDRSITEKSDSGPAMLRRLIDNDPAVEQTIAELSAECGYSQNHLRVLFLKEYGVSPTTYRNQSRMARAMTLLQRKRFSVKEVAAMTGFKYVSHFSRLFKETYGRSPKEAR